ncbi:MAG TPA: nucleotidyltransferase domain-containing protein [Phenylobacterium sp.]
MSGSLLTHPRAWTPYGELNEVLAALLAALRDELGDNLVGLYLQGSFALGDFDEASDVDLIAAVREDIPKADIERFEQMHREIFDLPQVWAQHLELSYAPIAPLRRFAPAEPQGEARPADWRDPASWRTAPFAYPFWFLGNGATHLVRSEHDNTQVVRWVLREKGVPLFGAEPDLLVDPVTPDALRSEVAEVLRAVLAQLEQDTGWMGSFTGQSFGAVWFARILQTLIIGEVASKKSAVAFAQGLQPRWAQLVSRGWNARQAYPRGAGAADLNRNRAADPAAVAETLAFGAFVGEEAARLEAARSGP